MAVRGVFVGKHEGAFRGAADEDRRGREADRGAAKGACGDDQLGLNGVRIGGFLTLLESGRVAHRASLGACFSPASAARDDRGSEEVIAQDEERNDHEKPQRNDETEAQDDEG